MKITDLKFENSQFGEKFMLIGIEPNYIYLDKVKTDKISGYKYKIICADADYQELVVKIDGENRLPELLKEEKINHQVVLQGLEVGFYQNFETKQLNFNSKAKNISLFLKK